ncbi:MAG: LPP20 family lipoprotein [Planctomycetes bacterium]|nr:LPP20 family lipoprotein [Planctomycetota bacterium]MBI3833654.1 LPP20 family lipoprotein [Planctomycetota bacterium]
MIVDVTMEVPVERIITKIKELHAEHYHGNKVTTTDIQNIKQELQTDAVRATGSGVPRPQVIQQASSSGVDSPQWLAKSIEAVGQGTDPAIDTAQGKLKAGRAAYADAMRKLAEQVQGLEISSSTHVRDFITQHDEIRTQVDSVIAGAIADAPTFDGGIASVRVSLPAADVWSVVHQYMVVVKRRG